MSNRREKLLQVARETREALFAEWGKNKYFTDYNNFFSAERGLLSEAMGLTATLLMLVGFYEEKNAFSNGDDEAQLQQIITSAVDYIYSEAIEGAGYTVSPLLPPQQTAELFNQECAYTDTLTWVLSSSTLLVYAKRKQWIQLDEAMMQKAIALLSDSIARILNGQLDCGAWGFSTDKGSKPSLYFTYAVATSLADVLDYIFGEWEAVSDDTSKDEPGGPVWEIINMINAYFRAVPKPYYPKKELAKAVGDAKASLQEWLLKNCFPLLPKIAACTPLTQKERELVGVSRQTHQEAIENWGDRDFLQLYYAHYIIDILTTSSSDFRLKESIMKGQDPKLTMEQLRSYYRDNRIVPAKDIKYFFGKEGEAMPEASTRFFDDYVAQAIHSVRYNFMAASRTEDDFWNGSASELIIPWEHTDEDVREKIAAIRGIYKKIDRKDPFTEPALVPMALRANVMYCFYIIQQADITVDNLFETICSDRSTESGGEGQSTTVRHLWDALGYNLSITERAIESLVDYRDYLDKMEAKAEPDTQKVHTVTSIDAAIDQKIADYLRSEEGSAAIRAMGFVPAGETAPVAAVPAAVDEEAVARLVDARLEAVLEEKLAERLPNQTAAVRDQINTLRRNMGRWVSANPQRMPDNASDDPVEEMLSTLVEMQEHLNRLMMIRMIKEAQNTGDVRNPAQLWDENLTGQFDDMMSFMVAYCDHAEDGNYLSSKFRDLMKPGE